MLGIFILGKAMFIQRVQGQHWRSMSDSLHIKVQEMDAERGTIYSEDGQMLSTSIPQFDIYMDLMADGLRADTGKIFRNHIDSFSIAMATYFGDKTAAIYKQEIKDAYRKKDRYYLLRKKMSFEQYKAFRTFPLVRLGKNKSGIIVEEDSKRLLPFGLLANRTIGLSREYLESNGKVKKQNVGLEMSYDSLLTGQKGQRLVRYASGALIPVDGSNIDPEQGKDIYTTLDVNIQDIAENALYKMVDSIDALYGTCIVMETSTGKIKAIANLGRRPDGTYAEDDNYALRVTEPGSTIKLSTLLAALENGSSQKTDEVVVGGAGHMMVGPRMVTDAERAPRSTLSVQDCFAHSSNVGMAKIGYKAFGSNPVEYKKYLHRFLLDVPSPVDLTHLPRPRTAPLERKNGGAMNLVTMSFGYSIMISPLHTLTLYNAVANDGKLMKPFLVSSVQQNGITVKEFAPQVLNEKICKASTIQAAQESMEMVVKEGTARVAFKDFPIAVAGKTGTAHVADRVEGQAIGYGAGIYQASFVGYFPAHNPQYSCIVVVRTKPGGGLHYGGQVAAPVFKEIAAKVYPMYVTRKVPVPLALKKDSVQHVYAGNVKQLRTVYDFLQMAYRDSTTSFPWGRFNTASNVIKGLNQPAQVVPDVNGMGLKDALLLLEKRGLKVQALGRGKVIAQSITAGNPVVKGSIVYLRLG